MPRKQVVLAFDAYGTLLSTESVAKQLAEHFGEEKATTLAQSWRKYQLEYTWRLNSMGIYEDFSHVTRSSLRNSLAEARVSLDEKQIDELMQSYDSLSIFPDVAQTLEGLRKRPDIHAVVFSNGTHKMVSTSVTQSPDLKEHAGVLKEVIVVEEARRYKPAPQVYHYLAEKVGKDFENAQSMSELWLISGNPFDIVGARAVGMNALWVDRAGNGWQDHLVSGEQGRPTAIVQSLEQVLAAVSTYHDEA